MGAEDFSYVLERVPGAMAFLGACPPGLDPETAPGNHSNLVVFDEEPLPAGVALYAQMALQALAGLRRPSGRIPSGHARPAWATASPPGVPARTTS